MNTWNWWKISTENAFETLRRVLIIIRKTLNTFLVSKTRVTQSKYFIFRIIKKMKTFCHMFKFLRGSDVE